ncbi:hypothetical protein CEXT_593231 [Caerostris extrusa]|uniref:Uncharacterized protein n=1 Tax=Caerostris extrusa TaxID=172846 RepID=A0AAV4SZ78_CAEEX|nr:hypothetical protein CEXT_593231 [Caerostris extrusa]
MLNAGVIFESRRVALTFSREVINQESHDSSACSLNPSVHHPTAHSNRNPHVTKLSSREGAPLETGVPFRGIPGATLDVAPPLFERTPHPFVEKVDPASPFLE